MGLLTYMHWTRFEDNQLNDWKIIAFGFGVPHIKQNLYILQIHN